ncbi:MULTISPECIES: hypothetical protein [Bacteroidaceae]|jgi:hypothetical protein|uniref:hypothetical protein n=1 Tax=Bacteroidaceae TaxID=815 RepID=UPI000B391D5A|nr:hypothetical protein [Phocaeicola dorei]OUP90741.1 hypothetical protein B5F00_19655 [Phocaeicola dorei]
MRYTTAGRASYGGFPGQLLFRRKEEFAGNALQAAGSSAAADLCSWKTGRRWRRGNRNRPVNMMVKRGGTALPDINAGENEIEKNAAWAGQARVCRGKHERDSPYPLHA